MNKINIIFITLFLLNFNSYATNKLRREVKNIQDIYINNKENWIFYQKNNAVIFDQLYKIDRDFIISDFFISSERPNQSTQGIDLIIDDKKVAFSKVNPRKRISDGSAIFYSFKVWLINCENDKFVYFMNNNHSNIFAIFPKENKESEPIYIEKNETVFDPCFDINNIINMDQ